MKKINIAIDGYSSCGKGTLAKQMAQSLGYVFIDSGAMYRAVTLFLLESHTLSYDIDRSDSKIINIPLSVIQSIQKDFNDLT